MQVEALGVYSCPKTEAKYLAASTACKEALWLSRLDLDMGAEIQLSRETVSL